MPRPSKRDAKTNAAKTEPSYPGQFGVAVVALEYAEKFRQENLALRMVLRRQGLSDAAIQKRVTAYTKAKKAEDSVLLLYRRFLESVESRLPEILREGELATLPIKGPHQ
jgi:hypothetical protein